MYAPRWKRGMMSLALIERYRKEWGALLSGYSAIDFRDEKPTNPLLLNPPSAYFQTDRKMMIFGRETNDWERTFPCEAGVDHLLDTYDSFYNSGFCYSPYDGYFWNWVSEMNEALADKIRPSEQTLSTIWNNVIKIGKYNAAGAPSDVILTWEKAWFDVASLEVSELSPDIVIFLTGECYDPYIRQIFPDASFDALSSSIPKCVLARVGSCGLKNAIRTLYSAPRNYPLLRQSLTYILNAF
jgi:hypothetical protein